MPTFEQLRADVAADFLTVDGLEPVTWQRLDEAGTPTLSVEIPHALQRASTNAVMVGDRLVAAGEVTFWHLLTESLGDYEPAKGDTITAADNVRWVVWTVETQTFRTRYRLTCVRE